MNQNFLIIIYTLLTYLLGGWGLMFFNNKLVKKQNLFLNISLSWGVGNALLVFVLYVLAFTGKLCLIKPELIPGIISITGLLGVLGLIKLKKLSIRIRWQNWLLLLGIVLFLLPVIKNSFVAPLNAWDALGVWLIKAKALFYFPGVAESGFFKESFYRYAHQDYPLGLPLLVTAFYRLAGFINDQAVQFYLLNYFFGFVFLLTGTMIEMGKKRVSLVNIFLITLIIIEIPNMILYSHNGYADIPMVFFMATVVKLFLDLKNIPLLILFTLIGASFKVEGYSFVIVIGITFLIRQLVKQQGLRKIPILKTGMAALIGLTPIIIWEVYKGRQGISGTYAGAGLDMVSLSTLKRIVSYYFNELLDTNRYLLTLLLAFFVYILEILFMIANKMYKQLIPHLIVFGQLAAYTCLYLVSPHDLIWQLSSFERTSLHLIGMVLILIFYNFNCLWPRKSE